MERKYHRWTTEETVKLLELHTAGVNGHEIARCLNRTPAAIQQRLYLHNTGQLRLEVDIPTADIPEQVPTNIVDGGQIEMAFTPDTQSTEKAVSTPPADSHEITTDQAAQDNHFYIDTHGQDIIKAIKFHGVTTAIMLFLILVSIGKPWE